MRDAPPTIRETMVRRERWLHCVMVGSRPSKCSIVLRYCNANPAPLASSQTHLNQQMIVCKLEQCMLGACNVAEADGRFWFRLRSWKLQGDQRIQTMVEMQWGLLLWWLEYWVNTGGFRLLVRRKDEKAIRGTWNDWICVRFKDRQRKREKGKCWVKSRRRD